MTGIPVSTGGPPQSGRAGIADALAQSGGAALDDPEGAGEAGQDPIAEMTEVEARIARLEDALVTRGVLTEGDLTGPPGSDDQGNPMPPDPMQDPNAMAGGPPPDMPPAPPGAPA